jgi:hypothetical protein
MVAEEQSKKKYVFPTSTLHYMTHVFIEKPVVMQWSRIIFLWNLEASSVFTKVAIGTCPDPV